MSILNGRKKGFQIPVQRARLQFEGEYEGLEVVCRLNVPLETYLDFVKLSELAETSENVNPSAIVGLGEAFRRFSEQVLLEWNLEDEGEPIPARPDGMNRAPLELAIVILLEWLKAVRTGPLVAATSNSSTASVNAGDNSPARSSRSRRTS